MSRNPTVRALNIWSRKLHRWGAIAALLPLLVIVCIGLLLQVKKQSDWVQPPTARGEGGDPSISFDEILRITSTVAQARVSSWDDVDRLDVRPDRGIVKVRCKSRWEVQIDTASAQVVQVMYRRSDLVESIHDGSFFHDAVKLWVFLPAGAILLALWITGSYLWALPIVMRRRSHIRQAAREAAHRFNEDRST
jgi:uncharacterized iron-regulated membrane protein